MLVGKSGRQFSATANDASSSGSLGRQYPDSLQLLQEASFATVLFHDARQARLEGGQLTTLLGQCPQVTQQVGSHLVALGLAAGNLAQGFLPGALALPCDSVDTLAPRPRLSRLPLRLSVRLFGQIGLPLTSARNVGSYPEPGHRTVRQRLRGRLLLKTALKLGADVMFPVQQPQ